MKVQKSEKKKRLKLGLLVLMILMLAIFVAGIIFSYYNTSAPTEALFYGSEERADKIGFFQSVFASKISENTFSYKINTKITFPAWNKPGEILLQNPSVNQHLMALEIVLNNDDQVIFRSGYLKPGYQLKSAPLDTLLSPGNYQATAHIWAIQADSLDLLDLFEEPIEIIVVN